VDFRAICRIWPRQPYQLIKTMLVEESLLAVYSYISSPSIIALYLYCTLRYRILLSRAKIPRFWLATHHIAAVMSSSQFNLLYFASASSFTRKTTESFDAPSTAAKLFETLEKKYPGIKEKILGSCALTVNLDYVDLDAPEEVVIKAGDEVAVIPPVSSG